MLFYKGKERNKRDPSERDIFTFLGVGAPKSFLDPDKPKRDHGQDDERITVL